MKKITMFYLEECPFCQKAKKAMDELMTENKAYQYIISCMSNLDWGREIGGMDKATRFPEHLPHTS